MLNINWKDWCWSSNPLATWCEELTHLKRPWCWERLKAGGEGDDRGWDGWMASLTRWTWVWASSRGWWWTGRPGMLRSIGVAKSRTWLSDWTTTIFHTSCLSVHLLMDLRIVSIFWLINNPVVSICVQVLSGLGFYNLLGIYLDVGLLSHIISLCLTFLGPFKLFFQSSSFS